MLKYSIEISITIQQKAQKQQNTLVDLQFMLAFIDIATSCV